MEWRWRWPQLSATASVHLSAFCLRLLTDKFGRVERFVECADGTFDQTARLAIKAEIGRAHV